MVHPECRHEFVDKNLQSLFQNKVSLCCNLPKAAKQIMAESSPLPVDDGILSPTETGSTNQVDSLLEPTNDDSDESTNGFAENAVPSNGAPPNSEGICKNEE
jgi:hypothetical protein